MRIFIPTTSPPNVLIGGPVSVSPGFPIEAFGNDEREPRNLELGSGAHSVHTVSCQVHESVGSVCFSNKGHIIPANKAGRIVALRPHFKPIAKGPDDVDPGSFAYL